jgi:hypothetical protein
MGSAAICSSAISATDHTRDPHRLILAANDEMVESALPGFKAEFEAMR